MRWFDRIFGFDSKKAKELVRRRNLYKTLNRIPLPKRNSDDLKAIEPELYYVVWEKNLAKPKILRYSFISKYFALVFVQKRLQGYRHNIIKGKHLMEFGITHARTKLRQLDMDGSKDPITRYSFPDGLSHQNRKTQRTLYRRNLRRLLNKNENDG